MAKRKAITKRELDNALRLLENSGLSAGSKIVIERLLRARANPDAENLEALLPQLDEGDRAQIQATAAMMNRRTAGVIERAQRQAREIPDSEWAVLEQEAQDAATDETT